jgi:hypothetical protein
LLSDLEIFLQLFLQILCAPFSPFWLSDLELDKFIEFLEKVFVGLKLFSDDPFIFAELFMILSFEIFDFSWLKTFPWVLNLFWMS